MKKCLKIGLIVGGSLLVIGGTWAGLTKVGIIPNWFEIEILCNGNESFLRENEKIYIAPKGYYQDYYSNSYKHQRCIKECEDLSISGYTYSGYIDWCFSEKCEDFFYEINVRCYSGRNVCLGGKDSYNRNIKGSLLNLPLYSEWISSKFYGIENDIIQYESCIDRCNIEYSEEIFPYADKPIIYLYPTTETEVNVKLGTPENLSHTYPKYNSEKGRNVIAEPNGDLEDIETGRRLYALYREGKSDNETNFDEGFVVAGKDIIPFLEEKLAILGLNEREAEEFIVYWLPQMEDNVYNLIRFETKAEQDENMPLNITPKPDTVIRVMMDWKAIDEPIEIPEQQLETPERNGFTVVERGGSPRN